MSGEYEYHNSPDLNRDLTNCKKCPNGTYADQSQRSVLATGCKSCPVGKFQELLRRPSSNTCIKCPTGWSQGAFVVVRAIFVLSVGTRQKSCLTTVGLPAGFYGNELGLDKDTIIFSSTNRCKNSKMGDMVMFKTSGISQTANFAVQAVTMIILSTTLSHLMQVARPAQPCTVKKLVVSLMNLLTMIRLRPCTQAACTKSADCPNGRYSTNAGANGFSSCKNCSIGLFNSNLGSSDPADCEVCPIGWYQSLGLRASVLNAILENLPYVLKTLLT